MKDRSRPAAPRGLPPATAGHAAVSRRGLLVFVLACWMVSLFQHVPAFYQEHREGDELVYLSLAREMGWDLSNYTIKNDPVTSQFPHSINRSALHHHPPLYPLVLKLGMLVGHPVGAGLVFANLLMGLTLFLAWRVTRFSAIDPRWLAAAAVGLVCCPLLLFSTVRLHHDGLLGLLLAGAFLTYIEALEHGGKRRAVVAGLAFAAALNIRYTALAALPLLLVLQLYHLHRLRVRAAGTTFRYQAGRRENWIAFAIVMLFVVTLGLAHYYRVLATYGTLNPGTFIIPDESLKEFSGFMRKVSQRSRLDIVVLLLCIFPFLALALSPGPYRAVIRGMRSGEWQALFAPLFLYLLVICLVFSHQQLRYFAASTPMLYLGLPYLLAATSPRRHPVLVLGGLFSLLLMITTGFFNAVLNPPMHMLVIPSLFQYLPALQPYLP